MNSSRRGWLGSVLSVLMLPLFPFLKNHKTECCTLPEDLSLDVSYDVFDEPMFFMEAKVENIEGKAYITRIETWKGDKLIHVEENLKKPLLVELDEI